MEGKNNSELIREARKILNQSQMGALLKGTGWGSTKIPENPFAGRSIIRVNDTTVIVICAKDGVLELRDFIQTTGTSAGDRIESEIALSGLPYKRMPVIWPPISENDKIFQEYQYVLICPKCHCRIGFNFEPNADQGENTTKIFTEWRIHQALNPLCAQIEDTPQIIRSADMKEENDIKQLLRDRIRRNK